MGRKTEKQTVEAENKRLLDLYLPGSSDPNATTLLCLRAAELNEALTNLWDRIKAEGEVVKDMTGNGYEITKENPAMKSYNVTIRNYNAVLRRLSELSGTDRTVTNPVLKYIEENE